MRFARFEHGNGVAQRSVEFGERTQPRKHSGKHAKCRALRLGKRVDRVAHALHEGSRVGEPSVLRLDPLPFAGSKGQPRQLLELPTELLALGIACRRVALVVESRTAKPLPFAMRTSRLLLERRKPGMRDEYQALGFG